MIKPLIATSINTSSPVAIIDPDAVPGKPSPYGFLPADGSDFYIGTKADGSDEVLWPLSNSIPHFAIPAHPDEDGTLCYIRGTTATDIILVRYPG